MIGESDFLVNAIVGAIELGNDLQDDSPVDFASAVVEVFGQRLAASSRCSASLNQKS